MLYRAVELTVGPALRIGFRPDVSGVANLPATGPVILVANHLSAADQLFTPAAARRQVLYFAKSEYFTEAGMRGRLKGAVFAGLGQVSVERNNPRAAAAVIDVGVSLLAQSKTIGIYPEGTRSPDGRLYRFRTGVARLALRSGAPVVPVGIIGTDLVLPPGARSWHRAPVAVSFGPILQFAGRAGDERSSRQLREVTETIRAAVQGLSGQEYVDAYAKREAAPR